MVTHQDSQEYAHALAIAGICGRYIVRDSDGYLCVTATAIKPLLAYLKEHYITNNHPIISEEKH